MVYLIFELLGSSRHTSCSSASTACGWANEWEELVLWVYGLFWPRLRWCGASFDSAGQRLSFQRLTSDTIQCLYMVL